MSLNMPENVWINYSDYIPGFSICFINLDIWQKFEYVAGIKYTRVLNMSRYSYNNILIIVTNVMALEFFSTWICMSTRSVTNNFIFFYTSYNINLTKYNKFLIKFSFWLQWRQSLKWTTGYIFKCETTKMKLQLDLSSVQVPL